LSDLVNDSEDCSGEPATPVTDSQTKLNYRENNANYPTYNCN